MEPVLITRQADGRLALGRLAKHRKYAVTIERDGTIVMTPVLDDARDVRTAIDASIEHTMSTYGETLSRLAEND